MPLKETDLKDTETYKKASRADLSKVAAGNAKFFVYKDVELPNPAGKKQKIPAFLVLVDDGGIRKLLAGRSLLCKGICGIKDEKIAFEAQSGKVPYKALKTSVPLLLGKTIWIPAGMEEDAGEGETSQAAAPGTPPDAAATVAPAVATPPATAPPQTALAAPPAPPSAASLTPVWGKLVKDVQAYAAAHPERKADMFRDMAGIAELLKANKAAEAKQKIDQMQSQLDAAPPAAPEAKPAGSPAVTAQVTARWSALAKQLQAAAAANPEKKADLIRAAAGVQESLRAGKFDAAGKLMDTLDGMLQDNPREKEYRMRYQALEGRLAAALKDPARDASRLRAMRAFVVEKANARDFESALKALANLEAALATAPPESAASVKPTVPKGEEEQSAEDESDDDEEEAAELKKDLKKAVTGAMAQAKSGAPMRFMAILAGSGCTVIVARKVGGATQKLLKELSGGGGQVIRGDVVFDDQAHTFVVPKDKPGLDNLLVKGLHAETGIRYNVHVRAAGESAAPDSETGAKPDGAGGSLVEKRTFLLERWKQIPQEVSNNLKLLKAAIERELPEEDADGLMELSEDYLDEFYGEMKDAIDDDINSGDAHYKNAIGTIGEFRAKIASEPLIQHLKTNPLQAKIEVESILLNALAEVEQALAR